MAEVGGFGRDVQAGRNADALQRLVLDEVLADDLQNLHRLVGPVNALLAKIGKGKVGDIAGDASGCGRHKLLKDSFEFQVSEFRAGSCAR